MNTINLDSLYYPVLSIPEPHLADQSNPVNHITLRHPTPVQYSHQVLAIQVENLLHYPSLSVSKRRPQLQGAGHNAKHTLLEYYADILLVESS